MAVHFCNVEGCNSRRVDDCCTQLKGVWCWANVTDSAVHFTVWQVQHCVLRVHLGRLQQT